MREKDHMPMPKPIMLILCFTSVVVFTAGAQGIKNGIHFEQSAGFSWNPLGVLLDSKLVWRLPLVKSEGMLWETTKIDAGVRNEWTPADNLVSAQITLEPIAFFGITAKAGYYAMYDALGYGCFKVSSAASAYDNNAQKENKPGNAQGYWATLTPELKLKAGPVIAVNSFNVNHIVIDAEPVYLEVRSYLLHRAVDTDIQNNIHLLYECTGSLLAGLTYRYALVTGTKAHSHRFQGMVIVKPVSGLFTDAYGVVTAGMYGYDPLYNKSFTCAVLAGKDFGLSFLNHGGLNVQKQN